MEKEENASTQSRKTEVDKRPRTRILGRHPKKDRKIQLMLRSQTINAFIRQIIITSLILQLLKKYLIM